MKKMKIFRRGIAVLLAVVLSVPVAPIDYTITVQAANNTGSWVQPTAVAAPYVSDTKSVWQYDFSSVALDDIEDDGNKREELYTVPVIFADYKSDNEINNRTISNASDPLSFRRLNAQIQAYHNTQVAGVKDWSKPEEAKFKFPLYFGDWNSYAAFEKYLDATENNQYAQGDSTTKASYYFLNQGHGWKYLDIGYNENTLTPYATMGIVGNTLSPTGQLMSRDGAVMPYFDFDGWLKTNSNYATVYGSVSSPLSFPFRKYGYKYTFDSASKQDNIRINTSTNKITYNSNEDQAVYNYGASEWKGTDNLPSAWSKRDVTGFFPFNDARADDSTLDYGFGMRMDIPFTLSKEHENVFEFSGDDDVWVYVDGVLMLDLGGMHGAASGTIDFDNEWSIVDEACQPSDQNYADASTLWTDNHWTNTFASKVLLDNNTYKTNIITSFDNMKMNTGVSLNLNDGKVHTISLFYMERGMGDSNLKISFTFEPVELKNSFKVNNKISTNRVAMGLQDAALAAAEQDEFSYTIENKTKNNDANHQILENGGTTKAITGSGTVAEKEVTVSGMTESEINEKSIKNNNIFVAQTANNKYTTTYTVKDGGVTDNYIIGSDATGVTPITVNGQTNQLVASDDTVQDGKRNTKSDAQKNTVMVQNKTLVPDNDTTTSINTNVTFINDINVSDFTVSKVYPADTEKTTDYTFQISYTHLFGHAVSAGTAINGSFNGVTYTVGNEARIVKNNVITLKAGETAVFKNIPVNTTIVVEEINIPSNAEYKFGSAKATDIMDESLVLNGKAVTGTTTLNENTTAAFTITNEDKDATSYDLVYYAQVGKATNLPLDWSEKEMADFGTPYTGYVSGEMPTPSEEELENQTSTGTEEPTETETVAQNTTGITLYFHPNTTWSEAHLWSWNTYEANGASLSQYGDNGWWSITVNASQFIGYIYETFGESKNGVDKKFTQNGTDDYQITSYGTYFIVFDGDKEWIYTSQSAAETAAGEALSSSSNSGETNTSALTTTYAINSNNAANITLGNTNISSGPWSNGTNTYPTLTDDHIGFMDHGSEFTLNNVDGGDGTTEATVKIQYGTTVSGAYNIYVNGNLVKANAAVTSTGSGSSYTGTITLTNVTLNAGTGNNIKVSWANSGWADFNEITVSIPLKTSYGPEYPVNKFYANVVTNAAKNVGNVGDLHVNDAYVTVDGIYGGTSGVSDVTATIYYARGEKTDATADVTVNSEEAQRVTFPTTGGWENYNTVTVTDITLAQGLSNSITIANCSGGINIQKIVLSVQGVEGSGYKSRGTSNTTSVHDAYENMGADVVWTNGAETNSLVYTANHVGYDKFTVALKNGNNEKVNLNVTVFNYDVADKIYVLDYGLPMEILNGDNGILVPETSNGVNTTSITNKDTDPSNTSGTVLSNAGVENTYADGYTFFGFGNESNEFVYNSTAVNADPSKRIYNVTSGEFGDTKEFYQGSLVVNRPAGENTELSAVYTPTHFMSDIDSFYYGVQVTRNNYTSYAGTSELDATNATPVMVGKVDMMPATVVYYEDNFSQSDAPGASTADGTNGIMYSGTATEEGNGVEQYQSNDINMQYGYDKAYEEQSSELSSGSAHTLGTLSQAAFEFTGTGLDIISRANRNTGALTISIYEKVNDTSKVSVSVVRNGTKLNIASSTDDIFDSFGNLVKTISVNSYYENGDLYQIPLISWDNGTDKAKDYVVLISSYDSTKSGKTVYLDGIRIYNPIDTNQTVAYEQYAENSEYKASIKEVKQLIFGEGFVFNYTDPLSSTGMDGEKQASLVKFEENTNNGSTTYFLAGKTVVEAYSGIEAEESVKEAAPNIASDLMTYAVNGPNNELYLESGYGLAFMLSDEEDTDDWKTLQIGVKNVSLKKGLQLQYRDSKGDWKNITNATAITSASEVYYRLDTTNLWQVNGKTIVVLQVTGGDGFLSLTNIKVKGYTLSAVDANYIKKMQQGTEWGENLKAYDFDFSSNGSKVYDENRNIVKRNQYVVVKFTTSTEVEDVQVDLDNNTIALITKSYKDITENNQTVRRWTIKFQTTEQAQLASAYKVTTYNATKNWSKTGMTNEGGDE